MVTDTFLRWSLEHSQGNSNKHPIEKRWGVSKVMKHWKRKYGWKGQPLISVETIITLIGSTTTTTGLKIICI